jgi:hypothetical protein
MQQNLVYPILPNNILENLMELLNNFDCVNIILELAGYKYRNGLFIHQLNKTEIRYNVLNKMPKIIKYLPKNQNISCCSKPYYQAKIDKSRLYIPYVWVISTSIYSDCVHWYLDLKFERDGQTSGGYNIIHYIYRNNTKENRSYKNSKQLFSKG